MSLRLILCLKPHQWLDLLQDEDFSMMYSRCGTKRNKYIRYFYENYPLVLIV